MYQAHPHLAEGCANQCLLLPTILQVPGQRLRNAAIGSVGNDIVAPPSSRKRVAEEPAGSEAKKKSKKSEAKKKAKKSAAE